MGKHSALIQGLLDKMTVKWDEWRFLPVTGQVVPKKTTVKNPTQCLIHMTH